MMILHTALVFVNFISEDFANIGGKVEEQNMKDEVFEPGWPVYLKDLALVLSDHLRDSDMIKVKSAFPPGSVR